MCGYMLCMFSHLNQVDEVIVSFSLLPHVHSVSLDFCHVKSRSFSNSCAYSDKKNPRSRFRACTNDNGPMRGWRTILVDARGTQAKRAKISDTLAPRKTNIPVRLKGFCVFIRDPCKNKSTYVPNWQRIRMGCDLCTVVVLNNCTYAYMHIRYTRIHCGRMQCLIMPGNL